MADDNHLNLGSDEQKVSYGLGRQFGDHLAATNIDALDLEAVIAGMEQAFLGQPSLLDNEALSDAYEAIEAKLKSQVRQVQRQLKAKRDEYLQRNGKRNGVFTTDSGLQYEIKVKGSGDCPKVTDTVKIHYQGSVLNGDQVATTVETAQPKELAMETIIAGWREALQMMPVGSKWDIHMPAEMAGGDNSLVGQLPDNSLVAVEVELLGIVSN